MSGLPRVEDRDTGAYLKVLFRSTEGNFSSSFPFPGTGDPHETVNPFPTGHKVANGHVSLPFLFFGIAVALLLFVLNGMCTLGVKRYSTFYN